MWLRGEFGEVIRLNPTNAAAHANLGRIAFGQNRYAQAKAAFQAALQLNPSLGNARAYLGLIEARLGGSEEAFQLLKTTFSRLQDEHLKTQVGLELVRVSFESKGVRSSRRNSAHPSKRERQRPSCSLRGVSDLFGPRRQGSCYAGAGGAPVSADAPDVGPSFGKSG